MVQKVAATSSIAIRRLKKLSVNPAVIARPGFNSGGTFTGTVRHGPNYRIGPICAGRAQLQQLFSKLGRKRQRMKRDGLRGWTPPFICCVRDTVDL